MKRFKNIRLMRSGPSIKNIMNVRAGTGFKNGRLLRAKGYMSDFKCYLIASQKIY